MLPMDAVSLATAVPKPNETVVVVAMATIVRRRRDIPHLPPRRRHDSPTKATPATAAINKNANPHGCIIGLPVEPWKDGGPVL